MVRFALRRSRILVIAFGIVHAGAAALVFPLQTAASLKLLLWALLAASFVASLRRYALLLTRSAVVSGRLRDRSAATLARRDGSDLEVSVLATSFVTPALTVLNVRSRGERFARHVILVPDNVDCGDYRKVRVLLRWSRAGDADALVTRSGGSVP